MIHIIEVKRHNGTSLFRASICLLLTSIVVFVWQWRQVQASANEELHEQTVTASGIK